MAISGSGKPRLLVLDLVGNSGKHKLVTTADILAGKHKADAIERAKAAALKAGGPVNMLDAIDKAAEEIEDEKAAALAKQLAAEAKVRAAREKVKARALWEARAVDPFTGRGAGADRGAGMGQGDEGPKIGILAKLEKHGINTKGMSVEQANAAMSEVIRRSKAGEWSHKQEKCLRKSGETAATMSRVKASVLMDLLVQRNFRPRSIELTRERLGIEQRPDGYGLKVRDGDRWVSVGVSHASPEICRDYYAGIVEAPREAVA